MIELSPLATWLSLLIVWALVVGSLSAFAAAASSKERQVREDSGF